MKKITALLMSLVMVLSFATGAYAKEAPKQVSVWIGNEQVEFGDQKPIVEKSTTLVPARAILEALDYSINWDKTANQVVAKTGEDAIVLTIGSQTAKVNGQDAELSVAPKVVKGTTYIPLRFVAETAGMRVIWDQATWTVKLVNNSKGFIWEVEKDGNKVYLVGSIHVGTDVMYPVRSVIDEAFDESDHLVVEVNISATPTEEQVAGFMKYMQYQDGTKLSDHISPKLYAQIQELLKQLGAPTNAFDPYKPWQVSNELTVVLTNLGGFEAAQGIDNYFLAKANDAKKSILELESYDLQFNMFDSFSAEYQEASLQATVDAFSSAEVEQGTVSSINQLADLWVSGDAKTLDDLTNGMKAQEEMYRLMLKDRNYGMVEKVEGYLKDGKKETFFVVAGYLHMLGEHGVVTMLRENGYTVTQL